MKHVKTRCLANRFRPAHAALLVSATLFGQALHSAAAADVEILRDPWGTPHVFAVAEADGFFGLGYAAAEDRLLQMELIRRKAAGRLAEVFGLDWVDSDREARIAGHAPYSPRAFAKLPARWQEALRAYAAGVNAWREAHPEAVARRFKPLGIEPQPWTPSDCLLAARGILSLGSPFNAGPVEDYHRFSELIAQVGEAEALRQSGLVIDDSAAIVSEADMAKDTAVYQRLKQRERMSGFNVRPAGAGEEGRKMSHAWAVSGRRSTTGKPILESDPQLPLSSPPFLYEFHLAAGKIHARGVGVPGCPGLFIGWNRRVAWGASALGVDSHVVFLDRLTPDRNGYVFEDKSVPFERRLERIEVKGGQPVIQEVLTSRHGTVFNSLLRSPRAGEAYLLYDAQTMDDGASARMMLEVLDAGNWTEFRRALEHYYSPGAHVVYADVDGNVGYHTMVHRPLTQRSPRRALEGWTGRDEVRGRIPFDELPHLLNPDSGYVSHANNLPVGSWYPYDLGLATGGTGHTSRSLRLQELLKGDGKFSVADFERVIHRDDVNSIVTTLLPIARKVVEEDKVTDTAVIGLLEGVKGWEMHEVTAARFPAARGLGNTLTPYRGSGLNGLYGAGSGGVANLARAISERFAAQGSTPTNTLIRAYLVNWLRASANATGRNRDGATASDEWNARLAQGRPAARDAARTITIPYQRTLPLNLPVVDASLDIASPPLACLDTGTIWSQPGNIYSQIVDLADVDNSRSMITPGNAEDGAFRTNQVDLWVRGTMHPAPLSRAKVEALGGKAQNLTVVAYSGSLSSPQKTVGETPGEARFVPAIPPVAAETKSEAKPMPGRKPEDPTLEAAFRVILRQGTPPEEVAAKVAECRAYVKGNLGLTDQLRSAALLGEYLIEESAAGRLKVQYGSPYVLEKLKALLQDLGNRQSSDSAQPNPGRSKARAESSGARLPTRTSVRIVEPLAYSQEAPSAQALSAYLVRSPNPAPVVVQVISGGWNSSPPREANPEPFRPYLDAGLSVVTVAHRPVNETNHWPAPADDITRAIQFIRARATDWGIDPDRLAVKGRSSGGHVALMVGFGPDRAKPGSPDAVERQSSRPTCIIAGSAPTDLGLQMTELLKEENRPGLRREALRDGNGQDYLWERMCALLGIQRAGLTVDELARRLGPLSPVHVVTRDAPPVLLLHPGPADAFWPGDARLKWDVHTPITGLILAQRLKELGVPHELAMLPEGSEGRGGGVVSPQELAFLRQ
jgi:penicillin amidase